MKRVAAGLKEAAASLPDAPGVYIFKDGRGKVIYVGKASSLRKRVASYFQRGERDNPRLEMLRSRAEGLDFIVTANEVEALILEANLIKRHHPDYNIEFRDDKSYPYMAICAGDDFPRVIFVRGKRRPENVYYGPFAHAGAVRETIDTLRKVFPFRACRGREPGKSTGSPCLDYHIGLCCGPCTGGVSREEYGRVIAGVRDFMEGGHEEILRGLEERMRGEASRLEYENAARTRDRIAALRRILERQQAHSLRGEDLDVFGIYADELDACITVFTVRSGKIMGKQDYYTILPAMQTEGEALAAFLPGYYEGATSIPSRVLLSHCLPDEDLQPLQAWIREREGRAVRLSVPQRGEKRRLVERVVENARLAHGHQRARQASDLGWISRAVEGIYEGLSLRRIPYRIECYDISNLGADDAVGSMVVYEAGIPVRGDFRRFRIRGVAGQNDVAMMEEVLDRRLSRLAGAMEKTARAVEEGKRPRLDSFHKKPDLIIVDGGEGQLAAALKALERHDCGDIEAASLAKRLEEVHLPGSPSSVMLPRDSEALRLLQLIRDEAHRYAIDYHRRERSRRTKASLLDEVPGIGIKRKKALLRHYGSVAAIAAAPLQELASHSFMDRRSAENLYRAFHPSGASEEEHGERASISDQPAMGDKGEP